MSSAETKFHDEQLSAKHAHAIRMIKRSLDMYGPEGLAFSFNGGKDSTVLLHLLMQGVREWREANGNSGEAAPSSGLHGLRVFFFLAPDEFPEVAEFVHECDELHNLHTRILTCEFKAGLRDILATTPVKAVFLGTRRADPNCKDQEFFCPSSDSWPCFMRINPILDWTYHDIWAFLTRESLPYCRLYDQGYTSLGSIHNTAPNSALLRADGTFVPARLLADERLERVGRETDRLERSRSKAGSHSPGASLAIIGDEILSGKVADVNISFVAQALYAMGWRLQRAVVLPDDTSIISRELQRLMAETEVVITAGGLGPTVDDVTVAAVAQAFGSRVARNPELEASLRQYFGDAITAAHLKMADTPEAHTELIFFVQPDGQRSPFPLLKVAHKRSRVYVLPGVPHLLQRKWPVLAEDLERLHAVKSAPFFNRVIRLKLQDETKIAVPLAEIAQAYPHVSSGSYPVSAQADGADVLICLECKDGAQLGDAVSRFLSLLAERGLSGTVLSVEEDSATFLRPTVEASGHEGGSS